MNNNFANRINTKRNSCRSSVFTLIVDIIVYAGQFGVDYFMGKALDIYLSNNQGILENILKWILNNPAPFTIIVFFTCLFALMIYDYSRSMKLEKISSENSASSESYRVQDGSIGKQEAKEIKNYFGGEGKTKDKLKVEETDFPPRCRNRSLLVRNTNLEQVDKSLKWKIKNGLWYHLGEDDWYEVSSKDVDFYNPETHDMNFYGYLIKGNKKKIIREKDGSIKNIAGTEEKIENMFTISARDILANNNVDIKIRLDSDYLYGELFFDDIQFALENDFGEENVEVIPPNKPKKVRLIFN